MATQAAAVEERSVEDNTAAPKVLAVALVKERAEDNTAAPKVAVALVVAAGREVGMGVVPLVAASQEVARMVVKAAQAAVETAVAVWAAEMEAVVMRAAAGMVVEEKVRVTMVVARVAVPVEKAVATRQTARAQQRSGNRNPAQPAPRSRKVGRQCRRTTPCTVLAQVTHRSLFRQCI